MPAARPGALFFLTAFLTGFAGRAFFLTAFFFAIVLAVVGRTADANMSARTYLAWRFDGAPLLVFVFALSTLPVGVLAQSNRIDTVTPSAPDLAAYGKYAIGVRTIQRPTRTGRTS